MIKINLLPPELQGRRARRTAEGGGLAIPGNLILALVAAAFAFAWFVVGYMFIYSALDQAQKEHDNAKKSYDKLKKEYDRKYVEYAPKLVRYNLMMNQKEILEELKPEKRLLWSEKINMLSDLVPNGVFITGVQVDEKITMVETDASKREREEYAVKKKEIDSGPFSDKEKSRRADQLGDEPKPVEKPQISQSFTVKAITLLRKEGSDRITKAIELQQAMNNHEYVNQKNEVRRFRDGFEKMRDDPNKIDINTGAMEETTVDGLPVWSFEYTLQAEKPKPKAKPATGVKAGLKEAQKTQDEAITAPQTGKADKTASKANADKPGKEGAASRVSNLEKSTEIK